MKLTYHTYKISDLPDKYLNQINSIKKNIIQEKKDLTWKNYTDEGFDLKKQVAITLAIVEDKIKIFATIYTNSFYGANVYRIFNRIYKTNDIRDLGARKKYNDSHITHPILFEQEKYVRNLNSKFYFISRQRNQTKWLNYYINNYNTEYKSNLIVTDEHYKICTQNQNNRCCQLLIYPSNLEIPFLKCNK